MSTMEATGKLLYTRKIEPASGAQGKRCYAAKCNFNPKSKNLQQEMQ